MAFVEKRLKAAAETVDRERLYTIAEAAALVKSNATAKFDETVEVSMNLGIDPRHADQNVRGAVNLPNGTGKTVRVAVFARDAKAEEAKEAGADIVGAEDLMETIQSGEINFERLIATPDMMPLVGRLGKVLGPKGLMPNPKVGTVTPNPGTAVKDAKGGQCNSALEKQASFMQVLVKPHFLSKPLRKTLRPLLMLSSKPNLWAKGAYVKRIAVSSTMGPKIDIAGATRA